VKLQMDGSTNALSVTDDPGDLEGPRVLARIPLAHGAMNIEASAYYRLNRKQASSTTSTLALIAEEGGSGVSFQVPFTTDRAAVSGLLDWPLGKVEPVEGWSGGPHFMGGLELRAVQAYAATYDEAAPELVDVIPASGLTLSPCLVLGMGFEIRAQDRVGLRAGWYLRPSIEPQPDYTAQGEGDDALADHLDWNRMFALDLFWRL
jgi:hypothetical protein